MSEETARSSHKKMRKRKEFNAASRFRFTKQTVNDALQSSEDELFIPHPRTVLTKTNSSRYRCFRKYSQSVVRIFLLVFFLISSISLIYSNIRLNNEVQHLSTRLNEVETKFSNVVLHGILPTTEHIKTRLNILHNGNLSYIYHQIQKLTLKMLKNHEYFDSSSQDDTTNRSAKPSKAITELDNLNQEKELKNEIQKLQHDLKLDELITRLERLTNLVYNTSNHTSVLLRDVQLNLGNLQNQIDDCQCSKESNSLKRVLFSRTLLTKNNPVKSISNEPSSTNENDINFNDKLRKSYRSMSIKRRQLFVGVLDNSIWTVEKLCAYFNKHASTNDEQYIVDCKIMSYSEPKHDGKSFAFITFTDETCVDRCMKKRLLFTDDYGITIKRLLPDSITKCERLVSSQDIVVRLAEPDSLFIEENIRSYFSKYGDIVDFKMLEEENTAGICFITFDDFDSSDRILLDLPHYLNGQELSVYKYTRPEYILALSQYRFVEKKNAHQIKRWYPIYRNLKDLQRPLHILHKTQIALLKYNMKKNLSISKEAQNIAKQNLHDFEAKYDELKKNFVEVSQLNRRLKNQIGDLSENTKKLKYEYEGQIENQQKKNQQLQEAIAIAEKQSCNQEIE